MISEFIKYGIDSWAEEDQANLESLYNVVRVSALLSEEQSSEPIKSIMLNEINGAAGLASHQAP
jgi:hypothetical protein